MKKKLQKSAMIVFLILFSIPLFAQAQLTVAQQKELQTLSGQLSDPGRSPKTKTEAAELLLAKGYPQASESLRGFLVSENQAAKIAVAEAIARGQNGDKSFIEPLLSMLTGTDAAVRPSAARALAVYKNHGVAQKLIEIVTDPKRSREIRVVTISSLQLVLDKNTVDALVRLLDDEDVIIQEASAKALAKLTNIKAFEANRNLAKDWWQRNRDRAPSEWLAALADSLARSRAELQSENQQLRERLNRSLRELYNVTPLDSQDKLLLTYLGDPLAEVRLAGITILESRIVAGDQVSELLFANGLGLLSDPDWRVREKAALLSIHSSDHDKVLELVLKGLAAEETAAVRQAYLLALGQIGKASTCDILINEITVSPDPLAATAASSLARITSRCKLDDKILKTASDAIIKRYLAAADIAVELRESLINAMGELKSPAFTEIILEGLKDRSAAVRLAAVEAASKYENPEYAKLLAAMAGDSDRGVRRAVVVSLAKLGGVQYLNVIVAHSDPKIEPDDDVRNQSAMLAETIFTTGDVTALKTELDGLGGTALETRIEFLTELAGRISQTSNGPKLMAVKRQLGMTLTKALRYKEATAVLGDAYEGLIALKSATAEDVWLMRVEAMLMSDDQGVIGLVANHNSDSAFAAAYEMIIKRLNELKALGQAKKASDFASAAVKGLAPRITVEQREKFSAFISDERN